MPRHTRRESVDSCRALGPTDGRGRWESVESRDGRKSRLLQKAGAVTVNV
jgi:hypothetical protein